MNIDTFIFQLSERIIRQSSLLDSVIIFSGTYLPYIVFAGIIVWLAFNWNRNTLLYLAGAAVLSRFIIVEIIRVIWERSRPFVQENIVPLISHSASASFPSGHASFFFALSFVIYLNNKKAGIVFLILSSIIVIARVLSGIHWFSDIIVGAAIGIISGYLISKIKV